MPSQFLDYMNYVTGMAFEEAPDFSRLKALVTDAATQHNIDIFDNVFDWTLLLTKRKFSSNPGPQPRALSRARKSLANHIADIKSGPREIVNKDDEEDEIDMIRHRKKAAKFRFKSYEEVKVLIYKAYSKRIVDKKKAAPKEEEKEEKKCDDKEEPKVA